MNREEIETALHDLRRGNATFSEVSAQIKSHVRARAGAVLRKHRGIKQGLLGVEDIEQEMWVAIWRAVDGYDEQKYKSILVYCELRMFSAARHAIARAAGYPDPRRAPVAVPVVVEDIAAEAGVDAADPEQIVAMAQKCAAFRNGLSATNRALFDAVLRGEEPDEVLKRKKTRTRIKLIRFAMDDLRSAARVAMEN